MRTGSCVGIIALLFGVLQAFAAFPAVDYAQQLAPAVRGRMVWVQSTVTPDDYIMFGGESDPVASTLYNDVWVFNVVTRRWTRKAPTGTEPPPLTGMGFFVHNDRLYIFGGTSASGPSDSMYSLSLRTFRWRQINADSDDWPSAQTSVRTMKGPTDVYFYSILNSYIFARYNLATGTFTDVQLPAAFSVYDPGCLSYNVSHTLCYGGAGNYFPWTEQNTIHLIRYSDLTWTTWTPSIAEPAPTPSLLAAVGKHEPSGDFIAVGGLNWNAGERNSIWRFSASTSRWINILPQDNDLIPTSSAFEVIMDATRNKAVIFGGHDNQVIEVDMATNEVSIFSQRKILPAPRVDHNAVAIGTDFFVLFGKDQSNTFVRDVAWVADTAATPIIWRRLLHNVPRLAGASVEPVGASLVILFGETEQGTLTNQVLRYFPYSDGSDAVSELAVINDAASVPLARKYAASTVYKELIYISGGPGVDDVVINDLWMLNPQLAVWRRIIVQDDVGVMALTEGALAATRVGFFKYGGFDEGYGVNYAGWVIVANDTGLVITEPGTYEGEMRWEEASNSGAMYGGNGVMVVPSEGYLGISMGGGEIGDYSGYLALGDQYLPPYGVSYFAPQSTPIMFKARGAQIRDTLYTFGGWSTLETSLIFVTNIFFSLKLQGICTSTVAFTSPCAACSDGSVTNNDGTCTSCPLGHYHQEREGETVPSSCVPCGPGTYLNRSFMRGKSSCTPCAEGSYQPNSGASSCLPCTNGSYCPVGASNPVVEQEVVDRDLQILPISAESEDLPQSVSIITGSIFGGIVLISGLMLIIAFKLSKSKEPYPESVMECLRGAMDSFASGTKNAPSGKIDEEDAFGFCQLYTAAGTVLVRADFDEALAKRNFVGSASVTYDTLVFTIADLESASKSEAEEDADADGKSSFRFDFEKCGCPLTSNGRALSDSNSTGGKSTDADEHKPPRGMSLFRAMDLFNTEHNHHNHGVLKVRKTPFGGWTTCATYVGCIAVTVILVAGYAYDQVVETRGLYPTDMLPAAPSRSQFTARVLFGGVPAAAACNCSNADLGRTPPVLDLSQFGTMIDTSLACVRGPSSCEVAVLGSFPVLQRVSVPTIRITLRDLSIFASNIQASVAFSTGGGREGDLSGYTEVVDAPPNQVFRGTASVLTVESSVLPTYVEDEFTKTTGSGYQVSRPVVLGGGNVDPDRFAADAGVGIELRFSLDARTTVLIKRFPRLQLLEFLAALAGAVSGVRAVLRAVFGILEGFVVPDSKKTKKMEKAKEDDTKSKKKASKKDVNCPVSDEEDTSPSTKPTVAPPQSKYQTNGNGHTNGSSAVEDPAFVQPTEEVESV